MIYGYVRISTKKQVIARQVSNILKIYPNAKIFQEVFTGTTVNRPEWNRLKKIVAAGDTIVFDSVSRMSRNAVEGIDEYFDFFEKGNYVYTFKKRCLENLELELPDEATTMILNTKGTHGAISQDIKSFYDYVNNHIVTTDFTKQIDDEISYLKLDTKVRREFMLMEARLLDERREGEAVGIAKGKEIGLAEGEANANIATAKRMLAKGCYSLEDIAELTNLSLADVEKLKEEQAEQA